MKFSTISCLGLPISYKALTLLKTLLNLFLFLGFVPLQMSASTEILSDYKKTKEGLLYTIEEDSVTILGSGKHFKIIDRTLVIPDTVENLPVTKIGKQAFKGQTHFTKLSLPNQLQTIGAYAFSKTNMVKFRAPSSLEKLEIGAFNRCRLLKEVDLKYSKIETIKSFTFSACPNL